MHFARAGFAPDLPAGTGIDGVSVKVKAGIAHGLRDGHPDIDGRGAGEVRALLYVLPLAAAGAEVYAVDGCSQDVELLWIAGEGIRPHAYFAGVRSTPVVVLLSVEQHQGQLHDLDAQFQFLCRHIHRGASMERYTELCCRGILLAPLLDFCVEAAVEDEHDLAGFTDG